MNSSTVFLVKSDYAFEESERFSTYEELSQRLRAHSKHDFVYYWRRDSRTVEGAHLKTARPISKKLKYYSVKYACVFGGQKFSTRGRGERSTHNQTKRMDCPAFISLRASKCGKYLQVMQVCNQHNHEISEDAIKQTPHYRKLTPEVKEEVLHLLSVSIHRDEIIKYVQLRAGVQLISKTINNFMLELKTQKYVPNAVVLERIQQFLETTKTVLAIDTNYTDGEPSIEVDQMVKTDPSSDGLEPYIENFIEEQFEPLAEFDSTIEFDSGNCDVMSTGDGDGVPEDIIDSIELSDNKVFEFQMESYEGTSTTLRCENCAMTKSKNSLESEINNLRQMKRRLIREMSSLKWKKCKLLNNINQLE